jgi:hypothetical protein
VLGFLGAAGCDTPTPNVVLENRYPAAASGALTIYRGFWQAVSFGALPAGASSAPQTTVAASDNRAYVLVAPGWDPGDGGAAPPTSLLVLQSRAGFSVHLNTTLHIPVDDTTFAGNCGAGSVLPQADADFVTQRVFAADFAGLTYDAATCATGGRGP